MFLLPTPNFFFQNDEELILALYLRLANDLELRASALPPKGVAERFRTLMLAKLGLVGPYRQAFAGLFAKMLDPRTNIGVLSNQTELVRLRARAAFARVVHGAGRRAERHDGADSRIICRPPGIVARLEPGPNAGFKEHACRAWRWFAS